MTHQDKQHGDDHGKNGHRVAESSDAKRVTPETVIRDAEHTISRAVDGAREQIKTAQERAKEALGTAEKEVTVLVDEVKQRMAPVDHWVRTTTQEHPYLVVSTAVGVSFLAGFLMRRRTAVGAGIAIGFLAGCLISGSGLARVAHAKA